MNEKLQKQISLRLKDQWYEELKKVSDGWTNFSGELVTVQDIVREAIRISFGTIAKDLNRKKQNSGTSIF